jgi:hypothetical protein
MDPARLQSILASYGSRSQTAGVYPASLRGLIDHRREPRWVFARFHHDAKALAETVPVQTPYVDGPWLARSFDQIACVHMSGLLLRSHMNAGQDGFRDPSP